ncbi:MULTISPECIES: fluoride efflux transporter CrcB [Sporosarcina]|uniref:Fluoride-specific ion channel FluC n=1 Tax=Sporosarcina contaminans TaxID=633403 RepID=A0ABW3U1G9_9BACL
MKNALFVGIAGAFGAIARVWMGTIFHSEAFPFGTLIPNLIGSFSLCFLSGGAIRKLTSDESLQTAVTTGFLGSFTTFSAFSLETVELFQNGQHLLGIAYLLLSIVGGLAAGLLGSSVSRKKVSV